MKKWYQLALFNLFILAFLGLLLRYKTIYPLPFVEYKNLLHAHSHFAFSGWISFLLQLLILSDFTNDYKNAPKFWNRFFVTSAVVNYAMIASFAAVGYAGISIALSTVELFLSYVYSYKIYKTMPQCISKNISSAFAKAALFFLVLSSAGPYALAISIATKADGHLQHNALYFFLYFQYAGWFTFAVLAFLFKNLEKSPAYKLTTGNAIFNLFVFSCIPAYLFVCSFEERTPIVTSILVATTIFQTIALLLSGKLFFLNKQFFFANSNTIIKSLYFIALISFALKFVLQFLSLHPQLQQIFSSYRPITIAYLHLVFLCFVSICLLAILVEKEIIPVSTKQGFIGISSFVAGVIVNELLLSFQGTLALFTIYPSNISVLLFANTVIMVFGASLVFTAAVKPFNSINYSLQINITSLKTIRWKH